jgi:drug/metabolite transporter (DMT)-like permease
MPAPPSAPESAPRRGLLLSLSPNLRGALWMLVSVAGATWMTVMVRTLSADLAAPMVAFLRSVGALLFLAPLLMRRGAPIPARLAAPWLHVLRGCLVAAALNMGFYAISALPVATATILFFLAPVFSTLLAPLMVGELVGPRRRAAVAIGFLGALVVVRPGFAEFEPAMLSAVGSSLCFATALLIGKRASAADGSNAVFATTAVMAALLTLPPALFVWGLPSGWAWLSVLALAAASSLRGYADIRAFAAGEASFVAPVSYLRLPSVALAGWLLFGEGLDPWALFGGAIIIGSTLYILFREARLGRAAGGGAP